MNDPIETPGLDAAVDELLERGWSRRPDLVAPSLVDALEAEARDAFAAGEFRHARVGRGADARLVPEIRSDRVRWIDPLAPSQSQDEYLRLMEALRLRLNRELQLGLFEFEGHLAIYPPGSFYLRHLDRTRGTPLRMVTCITYLNRGWSERDGGALRLYLGDEADRHLDLYPEAGTSLLFLAERFEHEVLPARRDRASLTGWFRRRPS